MLVFNINVRTTNRQRFFSRSYQDHIELLTTNRRKYILMPQRPIFYLYGVLQVLISVVQFVYVYIFYIIIFMAYFLPQTIYQTTDFF